MPNKYQLLAGKHTDVRTGKTYKKGEVIESDDPLDKLFQGKFANLSPATEESGDLDEEDSETAPKRTTTVSRAKVPTAKKK